MSHTFSMDHTWEQRGIVVNNKPSNVRGSFMNFPLHLFFFHGERYLNAFEMKSVHPAHLLNHAAIIILTVRKVYIK